MLELTAENFENNTLRLEIGRGGGIEIDLTAFGFEDKKMTAYQNYLGGGLLGKICSARDFDSSELTVGQNEKLNEIELELKKYFHSLTNPDTEWEGQSFEQNQNMPVSGY